MTDPSPAIRRNGLLQSCEPCRKSKLKCDHGRPVCGRCSAKNITQRCFYHPAPMTRQDADSSRPPGKRPRTGSPNTSSPQPPSTAQSSLRNPERPSTTPGYLGSTSFSAVLSENRTDIAFEEGNCTTHGVFASLTDRFRLDSGLEVLKFLYRNTICDVLLRRFYAGHIIAAVSGLIIEAILQSIRRVFDSLGRGKDLETQLRDLVATIFRATAHPLTSHGAMTVDEYFASFTDDNLRWDAVGVMLATTGIAMMSTSDSDPDFVKVAPDPQARDMLVTQVVEASGICLGFCDSAASVNELLGFFRYNDMLLRTQYYGDTSYTAWRKLGSLTATIYAAGLHQEHARGQGTYPPFLQQWRKTCFAAAFYADKCLSTFVGRPPFINYRYCSVSAPLDLSDEDLIAGGERLEQAMGRLDAAGWDTNGRNLRTSMNRLRFLLAVLREQALEIALGTFDEGDILQKYNKLISSAQTLWETCPPNLRHDLSVRTDGFKSTLAFARHHIYLEYLYTLFLVQRMVIKRTSTGHEALFYTSREVLATLLELTGGRYPGIDISRHLSWVALYYGLPAASTLAFELLRQTQEPGPHPPMPPRAELIRNLSVFVSCLSWVAAPGQGNHRTCKTVERKLSDILDQILDPRPSALVSGSRSGSGSGAAGMAPQEFLLDGDYANSGIYGLLIGITPI